MKSRLLTTPKKFVFKIACDWDRAEKKTASTKIQIFLCKFALNT